MLCIAVTCVNTDFIPRVALNGKTFTVLICAVKVFFIFYKERLKKCHSAISVFL